VVLWVAPKVLAERNLDVALDWVLRATVDVTTARHAAVAVFEDANVGVARLITRGTAEDRHPDLDAHPPFRGAVDTLLAGSKPAATTVPADPGHNQWCYRTPPGRQSFRAFLDAPILVGGTRSGSLCVTEKADGCEFSADDEQAVVVLANLAAVAIERSQREAKASRGLARVIPIRFSLRLRRAARSESDPSRKTGAEML
jgi:GAF domain-containing protein